MRKRKWLIPLLVLVLIIGGLGYLRARAQLQAAGSQQYVTDFARIGHVVATVSGSGHLESRQSRSVAARVGGEVVSIDVSVGDQVHPGDELIVLVNEDVQYQYERSQLDLQSARLSLRDLLGVGPDDPLPDDLFRATSIEAPASGRLRNLGVAEGDRVTTGMLVAEIADDSRAHLLVRVTPAESDQIERGSEATVYLHQFAGSHIGVVHEVAPEPVPEEHVAMVRVTVIIDNPAGLLRGGHTADVSFASGAIQRRGEIVDPPTVRVHAEISGRVESVLADEGQRVQAGRGLITIASPSYSIAVTQQMLRVRQSEMALDRNRRALDDLTVTAPIQGEISQVMVKRGDTISAGTPLLSISDRRSFRVTIEVDELEIDPVVEGLMTQVAYESLPWLRMEGEVISIAQVAVIAGGVASYPVEIHIPPHPQLREGMTASAEIEVARRTDVLVVPAEAVITADGESTVRVVTEDGLENRQVETGLSDGAVTEILSGLNEGEEVVIALVSRGTIPFIGQR